MVQLASKHTTAVTLKTGLAVRQCHRKCHHSTKRIEVVLTFCSNYGSISCRSWDIQCRKLSKIWNRGQRLLKLIESGTIW